MDKTLEKYVNKKYIERVSPKLMEILKTTKDTKFIESMLQHSNNKIVRLSLRNKNMSVNTMEKILISKSNIVGNRNIASILHRFQGERVPISSFVKYVLNEGEWQGLRNSYFANFLIQYHPYLTHLYPLVSHNLKKKEYIPVINIPKVIRLRRYK